MFLNSPLRAANNALINVGDEFSERIEDTPLEMFGMLFESLVDGSVTVEFDYQMFMTEMSGEITIHSDYEQGAHFIEATMSGDGLDFDLELYYDQEIMAARIDQISNNFYGIVFETFREDFRSFADLLGLSRQEVDEIVEMIESYETMMNASYSMYELSERLEDLGNDFLRRMEVTSNRVDITSGGERVNVRKIDFIIDNDLMMDFNDEFLDIIEDNEYVNAFFDSFNDLISSMDPWAEEISLDEIIREMRRDMRDMQSEMVMSLYVGRGNRLYRIAYEMNMEINRERVEAIMTFDLGSHAHDTWSIIMETRDDRGRSEISIEWEVNETSRGGETILRVVDEDRFGSWTDELILEWTDRGAFTLLFNENNRGQETLLTGDFTIDDDGFNLSLPDLIEDSFFFEQSLDIEISTARRTESLEPVDFINISDWGQRLLDQLEDFFGLSGMFFTPDFDDMFDMDFDIDDWLDGLFDDLDDIDIDELLESLLEDLEGLPVYVPDTGTTPSGGSREDLVDHELLGFWEFSEGRFTWFFGVSDFVWFDEDGYVYTDNDVGLWTVDGNRLTVISDFGNGRTFEFYFEIDGDILAITDVDDDTGYFERMW